IGQWLPAFDIALLQAGEQSGRLEACFRLLADYYTDRARLARQVISDLAYPAFLFHFAIFLFPFSHFFLSGNWLLYLGQTFGVLAWRPLVDGGQTPAEALNASAKFPELFANQYATGEISGKLDETLRRLHTYYQGEGSRKLHAVAQWTPRAVYFLVAMMIAYRIIKFWTAYFKQIQDAGGF